MQTILIPIMLVAAVAVGATPTPDPQYYHTWLGAQIPLQRVVYSHLLPLAPDVMTKSLEKTNSEGRSIGYNLKRVVQLLKPAAQLTQYQGQPYTTSELEDKIKKLIKEYPKDKMKTLFGLYDGSDGSTKDSKVTADEMHSGDVVLFSLGKIEKINTVDENKAIIKKHDGDGDDELDETEFTKAYHPYKKEFEKHDTNNDDFVTKEELHKRGEKTEGENPTVDEWENAIKVVEDALDAKNAGDGKLDLEEFSAFMFAGLQLN